MTWLKGKKPFVFARNVNLGIKEANSDVIILNDDAKLMTQYGFSQMQKYGKGIVAASIRGIVGNQHQLCTGGRGFRREYGPLCFIAVLIPKWVQDKIGLLDERFTGYGFEDNDYCRRAHEAGIPLWINDGCVVEHGSLRPTFRSDANWLHAMEDAHKIYQEKWS